jgi:hypothetical protein
MRENLVSIFARGNQELFHSAFLGGIRLEDLPFERMAERLRWTLALLYLRR